MPDEDLWSRKFDHLWSVMLELSARMNKIEGVEDAPVLSYEQFICLSQAFRKGLEDEH